MESDCAGFLLVDKPVGITSRECLNRIKLLLPKRVKLGHAGTLDIFASGLLVVGVGRSATKRLNLIMHMKKTYRFTARLDIETDTLDITGKILKHNEYSHTKKHAINSVLEQFKPGYNQTPPIYSALKYKGRRLSDLARTECYSNAMMEAIVEAKSKKVLIYALRVISYNIPHITCDATVSHGTYIRSLVRDIGYSLGTGGTTEQLRRLTIGQFNVENAISLEALSSSNIRNRLIEPMFS